MSYKNYNMESVVKSSKKLLRKEEVLALRPVDRDTYAQKMILELLDLNPKGITVSEIIAVSGLNRGTITKHLKHLVAIREAFIQKRGKLSIYYKNGDITKSYETLHPYSNHTFYAFHRVVNDEGKFIYVQEKRKDYYGAIKVVGGIMIRDEDFFSFCTELQKFTIEVSK